MVNGIVDLTKRRKDEYLLFKVDVENACDSISYSVLGYMLEHVGFHKFWINWMKACICASSMFMLNNGNPMEEFIVHKGLRQRGLLSYFLFLKAAKGLAGLVQKVAQVGVFLRIRS